MTRFLGSLRKISYVFVVNSREVAFPDKWFWADSTSTSTLFIKT